MTKEEFQQWANQVAGYTDEDVTSQHYKREAERVREHDPKAAELMLDIDRAALALADYLRSSGARHELWKRNYEFVLAKKGQP